MVKANFSFGGKLVLVLVTVVVYTFVLIAGAIGGGLYAYNNVKVGDLLNLVQQSQWVSEEYAQKTIQQFIADLQKDLSAEGLTLQTVIDISPKTGEMLDGVIDNLNENGIVTIDREALYNTPVDQLSSSLMDVAVVTATLGSMQDTMGITLPDMPIFKGDGEENGGDVYVAANSTDDGCWTRRTASAVIPITRNRPLMPRRPNRKRCCCTDRRKPLPKRARADT